MISVSELRHHRMARPVLLMMALVFVGVAYTVLNPAKTTAQTDMTQQLAEGKAIFDTTCSSCHGLNGEGTSYGVSLVGVGSASVDFQMGTGRMPAVRQEAQIPSRQVAYTQEQIDAVAAYVATFGAGPSIPSEEQYTREGLSEEEIAHGGALFRANCSACHGITGKGGAMPNGKYAPDLSETSAIHKWEAIRSGPQQMPAFSQEVLTDDDVRSIIAYTEDVNNHPNGGLTLGSNGPVSEGLWVFVVGIGFLCLLAGWIAKRGARAQ